MDQGTERSAAGNSLAELDEANLRAAMRLEASVIASAHPDIAAPDRPAAPSVIVRISGDTTCQPIEIAVHHRPWGEVEVDYREKPQHAWIPLHYIGGSFEVRST